MSGQYAEGTGVPVERTRSEIERTLRKWGATNFLSGWDEEQGKAGIMFSIGGRRIRLVLPLPDQADFNLTPKGQFQRTPERAEHLRDQEIRRRWRALLLVLKAKLEAVSSGISTFEKEFLADTLLPGGGTVADHVLPGVDQAYRTGKLPPLLPGGKPEGDQE